MAAIDNKPQYGDNITQTEQGEIAHPTMPFQQWIDTITGIVDRITEFIESRRLMSFRGLWLSADAPWRRNDVVYDQGWTMIAVRLTSDRAAPVPTGDTENTLPDVPAWSSTTEAAIVKSGQRYDFTESGWITDVRVWLPDVSQVVDYKLGVILAPDADTPIQHEFPIQAINADEWTNVFTGIVFVDDDVDVILYLIAEGVGQTQYVFIPNHWPTNQSSFAIATGQLTFDDVPQLGVEDTAFGVDFTFQPAITSPDWELVAHSATGIN